MEKEQSNQAPWIPQTPVKPICSKTEYEQSNQNQAVQGNPRLFGNKEMMKTDLEKLSCLDLLALADTASLHFFSGQNKNRPGVKVPVSRNIPEIETLLQKANKEVEESKIVVEPDLIKTPEKNPKRRKHRPKVLKEAKPKKRDDSKAQTTTPRRKYVRKKQDDKDQETSNHVKKKTKLCRRALDFEQDESFTESASKTQWLYSTKEGMRSDGCYNFISHHEVVLTVEEKGDTPIKKTSKGHARYRSLSCVNQEMPPHNVETVTLSIKKKRKTKSETLSQKKMIMLSPDEIWNQYYSVEGIINELSLLDINREETSETALVPYSNMMMMPLTRVKKRQARPKVDLDNETERVWKLLLEDINSNGIDGSDEEKEKWWNQERSLLEGRAHSFIARMHLIQGDRRFTPWKGSVVDSVVGVFLTQNVSDHLSSSAFMSLVAAYPAPSVPSRSFDEGKSSMAPPPIQITYLDSEESVSNLPEQSSVTILHPDEEKDYVNSEEASRSEIAVDEPKAQLDSDGSKGSTSVQVEDKRDDADETYLVQTPCEDSAVTSERAGGSEHKASFLKLLKGLESKGRGVSVEESNQYENSLQESPKDSPGDCSSQVKSLNGISSDDSNEISCCTSSKLPTKQKEETWIPDVNESTTSLHLQQGPPGPDSSKHHNSSFNPVDDAKGKKKVLEEKEEEGFDWDRLRRDAESKHGKREKTTRTMDSVDWEAIRNADVNEIAEAIKNRGMNNKLAERIQGFLDRLVREHGSIDLEWLRDVPPDKAKEYLLSFRGLGLKSVECVRLLTLHHLAFPVDTNVGRIAVRLGWVPLQPLPESLQLHLLEMYPVLESIQKHLWPRLCKLDQNTLYELHYQMITFGKVFCTKSKPNCNACPMRAECRHFASAFASARLALPSTEKGNETPDDKNPSIPLQLPEPLQKRQEQLEVVIRGLEVEPTKEVTCVPIVQVPSSPEPECEQVVSDIEDAFFEEDPEEIPRISLDMGALTSNLKRIMELQDGDMSTALVALSAEAASIPMPKLKNISRLRTEHQVYELPDSHPLIVGLEKREPDDPCSYLFAIWTPGETADSVQPSISSCASQETGKLCDGETCFSCNNIKETRSQIVRGTILIPCRTAMKGSFPLNGTYFQVNEVFADHDSSLTPIEVPREWLWNLRRKTVYFGTSIPTIFKGLSMETIQQCFWKGYVCLRGFDRKTRGPKPLIARLHFPASKMGKPQDKPSNPPGA